LSNQQRGGLTGMLKRPLPTAPTSIPVKHMEAEFLTSSSSADPLGSEMETHPASRSPIDTVSNERATAVQPYSTTAGTKLTPKPMKRRIVTISATFRIPEHLHAWLKRVSQHNRYDMTDIVIEALELHLPNFEDPSA
jgi:hypothetical protein